MNAFIQKMEGSVFLTHTKNEWFTSLSNLQLHHFPSLTEYIQYLPRSLLWSPRHIPLTVITQYYHIPSQVISATESAEQGSTASLAICACDPVTQRPSSCHVCSPGCYLEDSLLPLLRGAHRELPHRTVRYRWCPTYCMQVTRFNREPSLKLNVGRKELLRVCISV